MIKNKDLKVGTYIGEFATPGIGQILKSAGCEFVFLDMEHSGFSFETAKAVLRTLHDAGLATMLRPPSQENHHIARACDIGAQGICPPMMSTVEQAKGCIDAINYPPTGKRGAAFGIAHDDYVPRSVIEAISHANDKTCFIALLETAKSVENCENIAALKGCDCLWIGHFDLSNSLGIPGDFEHPLFLAQLSGSWLPPKPMAKALAGWLAQWKTQISSTTKGVISSAIRVIYGSITMRYATAWRQYEPQSKANS